MTVTSWVRRRDCGEVAVGELRKKYGESLNSEAARMWGQVSPLAALYHQGYQASVPGPTSTDKKREEGRAGEDPL